MAVQVALIDVAAMATVPSEWHTGRSTAGRWTSARPLLLATRRRAEPDPAQRHAVRFRIGRIQYHPGTDDVGRGGGNRRRPQINLAREHAHSADIWGIEMRRYRCGLNVGDGD